MKDMKTPFKIFSPKHTKDMHDKKHNRGNHQFITNNFIVLRLVITRTQPQKHNNYNNCNYNASPVNEKTYEAQQLDDEKIEKLGFRTSISLEDGILTTRQISPCCKHSALSAIFAPTDMYSLFKYPD